MAVKVPQKLEGHELVPILVQHMRAEARNAPKPPGRKFTAFPVTGFDLADELIADHEEVIRMLKIQALGKPRIENESELARCKSVMDRETLAITLMVDGVSVCTLDSPIIEGSFDGGAVVWKVTTPVRWHKDGKGDGK